MVRVFVPSIAFLLSSAPGPPTAAAAARGGQHASAQPVAVPPVDAAERAAVLTTLARDLAAFYVDSAIGARYAAALRACAAGAYDHATDPATFAEAVTNDLQAVAADRHLRVGLRATFARPRRLPADAPRSARPTGPPGLEVARMLGDVAYLRFNAFPDDPRSAREARRFLVTHADAKAVILDSRPNRGGGTGVMDAILPLFYDRPTVQVRMDTRAAAAAADSATAADLPPTLVRRPAPAGVVRYDHVIQPDPRETRLRHVPLYYLTSRRTASAAEHLAVALRRNRRALLIGETTAGANHFGDVRPLGARFAAFVPVGRSYDPDTGRDWEGMGVVPDEQVPADDALAAALARARAAGARPGR